MSYRGPEDDPEFMSKFEANITDTGEPWPGVHVNAVLHMGMPVEFAFQWLSGEIAYNRLFKLHSIVFALFAAIFMSTWLGIVASGYDSIVARFFLPGAAAAALVMARTSRKVYAHRRDRLRNMADHLPPEFRIGLENR